MKKLIALSCTLVLILCAATTAHAQAIKIGTVDMDKIFKSYYKTKEAEARINEARSTAKKELDDRMDTYKQTMDEINKLNDEITSGGFSDSKKADISKTRDEKISQFKDLEREITDFRQQKEKYLQDQAVRMRNGIVDEIMALIQAKIKSENYDYVFDKSGPSVNGLPIVIYARDTVDFSDDIIASLNKTKPKDSSSSFPPIPANPPTPAGSPKPTAGKALPP